MYEYIGRTITVFRNNKSDFLKHFLKLLTVGTINGRDYFRCPVALLFGNNNWTFLNKEYGSASIRRSATVNQTIGINNVR